jgi:DNA-binding beta-propeller fold protein YncE
VKLTSHQTRGFAGRLLVTSLALLALPAAAHGAGSVYVVNQDFAAQPSSISQYGIGAQGELSAKTPPSVAAGRLAAGVAVTPDGKSVYVTNFTDSTVSQYDVDPLSGALSPKTPATVAPDTAPRAVAVTPDGKSAYVTTPGPVGTSQGSVSQYSIDPSTGALSPKTPASVAAGAAPGGIAVTADGKSAFVANIRPDTVSQYDVDPLSGALSPKVPPSVPAGSNPQRVAVAPDSKSVYVTNSGDETVSQYDIDSLSGVLLPKVPASVAAGIGPQGIAVTPDGKSGYVTNPGCDNSNVCENSVSQYDIDPASGKLSPKTPAKVFPGVSPTGIAVSFDGRSAYVANAAGNPGKVSQYDIDPSTGTLSPKTPATVTAGPTPVAVAVGSLPQGNYPRPRGATPFMTYLVPAYQPCFAWNRSHGPPFQNYGSCNPPVQASNYLTVGTADSNGAPTKSIGSVRYDAIPGNDATSQNEADVTIVVTIYDVRNKSDLSDYTGELTADSALRITDKNNTPNPGAGPGTVSDTHLPFAVPCATTSDLTIGSTCTVSTSANAVMPGSVAEGKRAIWELGQVKVYDGGADSLASTTGDNTLFMDQGIFVP